MPGPTPKPVLERIEAKLCVPQDHTGAYSTRSGLYLPGLCRIWTGAWNGSRKNPRPMIYHMQGQVSVRPLYWALLNDTEVPSTRGYNMALQVARDCSEPFCVYHVVFINRRYPNDQHPKHYVEPERVLERNRQHPGSILNAIWDE